MFRRFGSRVTTIQRGHDRGRIERRHLIEAGHWRPARSITGVDEHVPTGGQPPASGGVQVHLDRHGPAEASLAKDQFDAIGALDAALSAVAEAIHNIAFPLPYARHVHADRACPDTVVGRAAREVGHPGAGDHRLGRRAAHVDARSAHVLAFDQRRSVACPGQRGRQRSAGLAGAKHDGVVALLSQLHAGRSLGLGCFFSVGMLRCEPPTPCWTRSSSSDGRDGRPGAGRDRRAHPGGRWELGCRRWRGLLDLLP